MFLPLHDRNTLKVIPFQRVTLGLILFNCAVFAWQYWLGFEAQPGLYASAGFTPVELWGGTSEYGLGSPELPAWATLLTYSFLHGDIWHLAGNMLFLWVFGDNVEDAMGHTRFLVFYLLGGAAAAIAEGALGSSRDVPLIGASGATAACIGAYLLLHPRVRIWVLVLMRLPLPLPAYGVIAAWVVLQGAYIVLGADEGVAWWAHLGGFAAGALMILVFRRRGVALLGAGDAGSPARMGEIEPSILPAPPSPAGLEATDTGSPASGAAEPGQGLRPQRAKTSEQISAERRRRRDEMRRAPRKAGWPIDPAD